MLLAQLIHSKTCRSMNKESEIVSDRELFSELFETPIHPLLINIVPPFVNECNRMFQFQLNGEALWRWREVCGQPNTVFALLQLSILPLGYRLKESAGERVGSALAESSFFFWHIINQTLSLNSAKRAPEFTNRMRTTIYLK